MSYGQEDREESGKEYFVLFHRDVQMEKRKNYGAKMLYDYKRVFRSIGEAKAFASSNLPAVIAKKIPVTDEEKRKAKDPNKPYLVAAKFDGKYTSSCMGETDWLTTYDAIRCDEASIDKVIEDFAEEGAKQISVGIELKLI